MAASRTSPNRITLIRVVEVLAPMLQAAEAEQPEVLDRTLEWHFEGASEPFVLDVKAFFADVDDIFEA